MVKRILLAGATGTLGRHVHRQLLERGDQVCPLLRSARLDLLDPQSLAGVCNGIDVVVSCAGASMSTRSRDRRSFSDVDWRGNRNLLAEACAAGVRKFVYVSLYGADNLLQTEYADAHEHFVRELGSSGIPYTVVRPTGFFSMFSEILDMARKGRGFVIGDGSARTNPIHQSDVAIACLEAISAEGTEFPAGGPDILTRRQIVELALDCVHRPGKIRQVPPFFLRALSPVVHLVSPRLSGLLTFGTEVSLVDCVAPVYGRQRLCNYFRDQAAAAR